MIKNGSDVFLDEDNWKLEADGVINDIKNHVKQSYVSTVLVNSNQSIYLNLETLETKMYCVELSGRGFRIVGTNFDEKTQDGDEYFETPYSMLNKISPMFTDSFGNELLKKLSDIR